MLLLGLKQAGWRLRGSSEHLSYLKGAPQFCTSCFLFKETKNADSLLLDSKWKKCVVPLPKLTHRGWTWSTGRCYSSQDGLWGLGKTSFFRKNYFMILIIFMILYSFLNFYSFIYVFIFGCAGSLLLHAGFLQLWRRLLFVVVCGFLFGVASFGREHRKALRLCFSALWGIFPDQGSNLGLLGLLH